MKTLKLYKRHESSTAILPSTTVKYTAKWLLYKNISQLSDQLESSISDSHEYVFWIHSN